MTKQHIFTILDRKAGSYLNLFVFPNSAVAVRAFQSWSSDPQSELAKFPDDFELVRVGTFDQDTGAVEPLSAPESLGSARQFSGSVKELRDPIPAPFKPLASS